jgi:hypothetical protein
MILRQHLLLAPLARSRRIALTIDDFNPGELEVDDVGAANWRFPDELDRAGWEVSAFVIGGVNQSAERAHTFVSTFRTFTQLLRFPMLKEGDTAAKRDHMQSWIREEGYRNGHAAIDACDLLYSHYFLRAGRAAKFQAVYLNHRERKADVSLGFRRRAGAPHQGEQDKAEEEILRCLP